MDRLMWGEACSQEIEMPDGRSLGRRVQQEVSV